MTNVYEKKLSDELWLICPYFNFNNNPHRLTAFKRFYERAHHQISCLIIVELAESTDKLELKSLVEAPHIYYSIVDRGACWLWQKEAMINVGETLVPDSCQKIGWIDGDILYDDDEWVAHTSQMLNFYVAVQPFKICYQLNEDDTIYNNNDGYIYGAIHNRLTYGHGLCWCYRRGLKLWPYCVAGDGDIFLTSAITNKTYNLYDESSYKNTYLSQAQGFYKESYNYLPIDIHHIYHGRYEDRMYSGKMNLCRFSNFNSEQHINKKENGLLEWNNIAPPILSTGLTSCIL